MSSRLHRVGIQLNLFFEDLSESCSPTPLHQMCGSNQGPNFLIGTSTNLFIELLIINV